MTLITGQRHNKPREVANHAMIQEIDHRPITKYNMSSLRNNHNYSTNVSFYRIYPHIHTDPPASDRLQWSKKCDAFCVLYLPS